MLAQVLEQEIRRDGPITFARYMDLALYHPLFGFYATRAPGAGGGYQTSPTLGPWFGRLFARQVGSMWQALGQPDPFTVVEVGAGRGDLAVAALQASTVPLHWVIVERSEAIAALQRQRLGALASAVDWRSGLAGKPPVVGCVIANEVLDNQPVHLLEQAGGEAVEVRVGLGEAGLVEVCRPVSDPLLADRASMALPHLEDGDRFEVGLAAGDWIGEAAGALERGWVVVVDYGDEEPDLWVRRPSGTVVTYRDEVLGVDPLTDPGQADITVHVNFSALGRAAREAGLEPLPLVTQRAWLESLGAREMGDALRAEQEEAQRAGDHATMLRLLAERSRLSALSARGGLGDLRVLIAGKDTPALGS